MTKNTITVDLLDVQERLCLLATKDERRDRGEQLEFMASLIRLQHARDEADSMGERETIDGKIDAVVNSVPTETRLRWLSGWVRDVKQFEK